MIAAVYPMPIMLMEAFGTKDTKRGGQAVSEPGGTHLSQTCCATLLKTWRRKLLRVMPRRLRMPQGAWWVDGEEDSHRAALRRELAAEAGGGRGERQCCYDLEWRLRGMGAGGGTAQKDGSANSSLAQHLDYGHLARLQQRPQRLHRRHVVRRADWRLCPPHTHTVSTISVYRPAGASGRRRTRAPMPTAVKPTAMTGRCPANGIGQDCVQHCNLCRG